MITSNRKHGRDWLLLTVAMTIHIIDEAVHDFLSFYNPIVGRITNAIPYLPLPIFTFQSWIAGLIIAVAVLFGCSIFVFRGIRLMIAASYVYGAVMLMNGLIHLVGSLFMSELLPGSYSAPFLAVSAAYLILVTRKVVRSGGEGDK
jgi:hypothetical protein